MSKHLTGSKRLAVIQRWINGHDDPDWEVLPTRKEGKYIVKKRETPIRKVQKTEEEESPENQEMEEESQETPKKAPKVPKKPPKSTFDPTINLEILNQLKLFGEEMERKRIKKEQKRMIKEVMNKEARKAPPPPEPEPEPEPQPVPMQYPYRRRNRIFEGLY
mgnify:CR=1 FL=1